MLANKLDLEIDSYTKPGFLTVSCVPVKWNRTEKVLGDKLTTSISLEQPIALAQMISADIAVESVWHTILDELLHEMFEGQLKDLIPDFISPDDPIYEHITNRFNNDVREDVYNAYFTPESILNLQSTLTKILRNNEL